MSLQTPTGGIPRVRKINSLPMIHAPGPRTRTRAQRLQLASGSKPAKHSAACDGLVSAEHSVREMSGVHPAHENTQVQRACTSTPKKILEYGMGYYYSDLTSISIMSLRFGFIVSLTSISIMSFSFGFIVSLSLISIMSLSFGFIVSLTSSLIKNRKIWG
ncbi:unnamed protein product [Nesidiocoris tenuis]|uniref:Uncharacterized protein n=1 Tax=Nesidiocoris tenuis TaxID=355587 RepID=A0A6H5FY67_9HEMI|nr:unnamed protein product [Nesidiocoris tenuis]